MPTNLPPEYFEAEKRYKVAVETAEKIEALEDLLSTIPKHKGTDHLRADLRRKLAKLKDAVVQSPKRGSGGSTAYHIDREGAGQVVLTGLTNVGKSALLQALTNAVPDVSPAPFTTWKPTPGMMTVENVQVQLIDTPPLQVEYVEPELINLMRRVDLLLVVVDLQTFPLQQLEETLAILESYRILPAQRQARPTDLNRPSYLPMLVAVNKCDTVEDEEIYTIFCELMEEPWPCVAISAGTGHNLDALRRTILKRLDVIRVYAQPPGREPDFSRPFVLKSGSTVLDFAAKVHKDFAHNLSAARVWGSSQFPGQMVSRDYVLQDGDIIELRT
jgi:small GTP-binding protein